MKKYILPYTIVIALNVGCKTTLIDTHGNQGYKTVEVGGVVWMAENLKTEMPGAQAYNHERKNTSRLGFVYQWDAAIRACPTGWRLPTADELSALFLRYGKVSYSGGLSKFTERFGPYAPEQTAETYHKLVADKYLNLPATEPNKVEDHRSMLWTNEESEFGRAYAIYWRAVDEYINHESVHFSGYPKNYWGFCRCVKIK